MNAIFYRVTDAMFWKVFYLLILMGSLSLGAREGKWVMGTGKVYLVGNITVEDARYLARQRARSNAINHALGVMIRAENYRVQFEVSRNSGDIVESTDAFSEFIRESRAGRIQEEGRWEEKDTLLIVDNETITQRIARNRFYVVKETEPADPNFQLEVKLPKTEFRVGEPVSFQVTATQDCYLTVFNISPNDSVYVIFPNPLEKDNRLRSNHSRLIPNPMMGYSFRADLPPDKTVGVESFVAIATKDSIVFQPDQQSLVTGAYVEPISSGMNTFWKWISGIEGAKRCESAVVYKISE